MPKTEIKFDRYRNVVETAPGRLEGEFFMDLSFMGGQIMEGDEGWARFAGSVPLMKIRLAWEKGDAKMVAWINAMSGHPMMAEEGDWSGIRDSEPEQVAEMEKIADMWFFKAHRGQPWPWDAPGSRATFRKDQVDYFVQKFKDKMGGNREQGGDWRKRAYDWVEGIGELTRVERDIVYRRVLDGGRHD